MKGASQDDISWEQRILGAAKGQRMQSMWVCVIVCHTVCVGVPVRLFACLHVTECWKLVSADGKQDRESKTNSKSGTKEERRQEWINVSVGMHLWVRMFGTDCEVKEDRVGEKQSEAEKWGSERVRESVCLWCWFQAVLEGSHPD